MSPSRSILVVDDDPCLRQTLVQILRKAGYEAFFAENAQKSLLCLQARNYDLIILDRKMPDMSGMALLSVIRKTYPALPVVFLTGNRSPELEREAWENGVRGYLVKPINPEKIIILVRTLCLAPLRKS